MESRPRARNIIRQTAQDHWRFLIPAQKLVQALANVIVTKALEQIQLTSHFMWEP